MNLNIFGKYEVIFNINGAHIDAEESLPGEYVYKDFDNNFARILSGGEIMEYIGKKLIDKDICLINIVDDVTTNHASEVDMEFFNPLNGEGHTIKIFINELIEIKGIK
jgi:hypothetical protein